MSYCTPCPPCDTNFPLLCEPLETTANGKRLVVEDSAACQKTIQSPVAQQVLKTDGVGNLTWTNGASGTVLRKDSAGLVEFATINSVLQAGPVDLGSQPLTTTGAISGASVTATGVVTAASVTATGVVTAASVTLAANPTTNLQATTKQYVDAADALKLNKAGDTMTGPLIVNSTIESNNTILATGNSSKIGYTSGGSVTQAGAKTNPVSLNRPTGTIIINNAALAANTSVLFNLNNNLIQVNDLLLVTHISGGTVGAYNINAYIVGDFIGGIWIRNITSGSLSESLTLQFMLLKSAIA
jgi:hypothetical protein